MNTSRGTRTLFLERCHFQMLWPPETKFSFQFQFSSAGVAAEWDTLQVQQIELTPYAWLNITGARGEMFILWTDCWNWCFLQWGAVQFSQRLWFKLCIFSLQLRISVFFLLSTTPNSEKDMNEDILWTSLASVVKAFISLSYQKLTFCHRA